MKGGTAWFVYTQTHTAADAKVTVLARATANICQCAEAARS